MSDSPFQRKREIEKQAEAELMPWLNRQYASIKPIKNDWAIQKLGGDYLVFRKDASTFTAELKSECKFTGNFFFETWSNKADGVLGWIFSCRADCLWYYFLDAKKFYSIDFKQLHQWCFYGYKFNRMDEVQQRGIEQHNDTWGRLVDIKLLLREMPSGSIQEFIRTEDGRFCRQKAA